MRHILYFCLLVHLGLSLSYSANPTSRVSPKLPKPATVEFTLFEGNNIRNFIANQGHLSSHVPELPGLEWPRGSGLEWPAGSGNSAVFASGIWVLGQIEGDLRSAAAEYASEWLPGTIPYDTQMKQPTSDTPINTALNQVYYIKRDDSSNPSSRNYNWEYADWPASEGAPAHDGEYFSDANENGQWDYGESFEDYNLNASYDPPDGSLITGEDPPLFMGEYMAWWVMNDLDTTAHNHLWDTDPLGIEAQVLVYTRNDDPIFDNVQFRTVTLVNKSGVTIDSTYFGVWSDIDLGDADDDAIGCDSTRSLAYAFNGRALDQNYGLTPPAVGYQTLQGPMVPSPGDTLVHEGILYHDQKYLEMTAFVPILKHIHPFQDPERVQEAYSLMQGKGNNYSDVYDPQGFITTFPFSGDPVNQSGWLERNSLIPSDRRLMTSSGPFGLPPWDDINGNGIAEFGEPGVQVIHTAIIIIAGIDFLDAITNMKYIADFTKFQFDHGGGTDTQAAPFVNASSHEQEILLNWFQDAETLEANTPNGYEFEGYNLYQGASSNGPWTRLITFDVENEVGIIMEQVFDENDILISLPTQFGDNAGLEHFFSIQSDILNDDEPLVNNKLYHFALDAYGYQADAFPKTQVSDKQIISLRPHVNYDSALPRDTLFVDRPTLGEVSITVEVLDPSQLTGLDYEIGFEYDSSLMSGRWSLLRNSASMEDTLFTSSWFLEDLSGKSELYVDGFELNLSNLSFRRPRMNNTWVQTQNIEENYDITIILQAVSPGGVDSLAWTDASMTQMVHMDTLYGPDFYYDYFEYDDIVGYFYLYKEDSHDVRIQGFASTFGGINGDMLADIPNIGGGSQNSEYLQGDLEIRFTESGQLATRYRRYYADSLIHVPFEVWDIERDIQLCLGIKDNNKTDGIQDTTLADWQNTLDLDWVNVFYLDYASFADSLQALRDNPHSGWCWQFNYESKFSIGDKLKLSFLNPISEGDIYSWTTNAEPSAYDEDALDLINVFPNPFLGYQSEQSSYYHPYVTISNLPNTACSVRIYSLGGHLVRSFDHISGNYETWDLLNTHGSIVASGMYLIHVEVEGLGNKILKLAVLQPER